MESEGPHSFLSASFTQYYLCESSVLSWGSCRSSFFLIPASDSLCDYVTIIPPLDQEWAGGRFSIWGFHKYY